MLTAVGQNIVVKIIERENTTKSGIVFVKDQGVKFETAEILSLGNAQVVTELSLKKGDKVLVAQFFETDMKDKDGSKIAIIHYENIAAKLDGK